MRFFKIKSLQRGMVLFLLVPVALLLLVIGAYGFLFARQILLDEWKDASILQLERAAHQVATRLGKPMEWIEMFNKTAGNRGSYAIQEWIFQGLRDLEGVVSVDLKREEIGDEPVSDMKGQGFGFGKEEMMRFQRVKTIEVTAPHYDAKTGQKIVSLVSNFKDDSGRIIGTMAVAISFDFLLRDIRKLGWWQSDMAFLVDEDGRFLAHTDVVMKGRTRLGGTGSPLEKMLLREIKEAPYGSVLRDPSKGEVGGFYRIKNTPWTLVLLAPGKAILTPIVRFRTYYFIGEILSIFLIILCIRFVVGKMVASITRISRAAEKVAEGDYGTPLPVGRHDEIGQLMESFNKTVKGLEERDFIRDTFGRYVDVGIAKELMRRPEEAARLGGEKREVAVLMSDLRDFTSLSEALSPEKTILILNLYFSQMITIIQKHRGIIVDFLGDAMLAFFDPLDGAIAPAVRHAVGCALEMQQAMRTVNARTRENGLPSLQMGIGVNSGEVVVGNIGSESRAKYGIVGAPVNLTQRIQAVAKGGEVLIFSLGVCSHDKGPVGQEFVRGSNQRHP